MDGNDVPRERIVAATTRKIARVAGELKVIGTRPTLVASFDPPGADERFRAWQERNAQALAGVPAEALRVEYGRAQAGGLFVRVRIDEPHVPAGLTSRGPTAE
jgi:hypothetical protein